MMSLLLDRSSRDLSRHAERILRQLYPLVQTLRSKLIRPEDEHWSMNFA